MAPVAMPSSLALSLPVMKPGVDGAAAAPCRMADWRGAHVARVERRPPRSSVDRGDRAPGPPPAAAMALDGVEVLVVLLGREVRGLIAPTMKAKGPKVLLKNRLEPHYCAGRAGTLARHRTIGKRYAWGVTLPSGEARPPVGYGR